MSGKLKILRVLSNPKPKRAAGSSDVRSPTSTDVRSPTKTSTEAHTSGNVTVTGGAGRGNTSVTLYRKNKRTKSAKVKRRKSARQKSVRSVSGKWVLRRVAANRSAGWWSGTIWSPLRAHAKKFPSDGAAARALPAARAKAGKDWIVLDVMPA
jgi:hypothetical protein